MRTAGILFLVALLVRVGAFMLLRDATPVAEESIHIFQAIFGTHAALFPAEDQRAPGIILLFDVVQAAFGPSFKVLRFVCAILGSLFVPLFYLWARRVVDPRVARFAALVVAVHPELVVFSVSLWSEPLYLLLLYAALFAADAFTRSPNARRAALAGVTLGIAALTRELGFIFAVFFAVDHVRKSGGARGRAALHSAILFTTCLLTILPWSISMSKRAGHPVLITMTNSCRLFLGNISIPPNAKGRTTGGARIGQGLRMYEALSKDALERDRLARAEAIEAIRADLPVWPFRKALSETRAFFTLNSFPAGRFLAQPGESEWAEKWAFRPSVDGIDRVRLGRILGFGVVAFYAVTTLGGAVGLALLPLGRATSTLVAFGVAHLAPTIVTFAVSRYRVPVEPIFAIGFAALVLQGPALWRTAGVGRRVLAVAAFAIFAILLGSTAGDLLPARLG